MGVGTSRGRLESSRVGVGSCDVMGWDGEVCWRDGLFSSGRG